MHQKARRQQKSIVDPTGYRRPLSNRPETCPDYRGNRTVTLLAIFDSCASERLRGFGAATYAARVS